MFLEFSKKLLNGFHIIVTGFFDVNQDVIKVNNNKNIKLFH